MTTLLQVTLIEALQGRYDATTEEVMNALLNQIEEVVVDITPLGKMDSPLLKNTEALTKFERLIDALNATSDRMPFADHAIDGSCRTS